MARVRRGPKGKLAVGRVLAASLRAIVQNAGAFLVLALIAYLPMVPLLIWKAADDTSFSSMQELAAFFEGGVSLLCQWTLAALVVRGTYESVRGGRIGVGAMLNHGMSRLLPALGVAFLTGLMVAGAAFGILLPAVCGAMAATSRFATYVGLVAGVIAVVVALVILCRLWVAIPAVVVERCGVTKALRRSGTLTDGARWSVFAVIIVVQLCSAVAGGIVGGLTATAALSANAASVLELVIGIVFGTWGAVAAVAGYYELRRTREGLDLDELAAVFE